MSTRQSRKTTPVPQSPPQSQLGSSRNRGESPGRTGNMSPTRLSRLQEKCQLQSLNDRLACYIDKVRQLEFDNNRLQNEVHTYEEVRKSEIFEVKKLYDNEIGQLRAALDDEATKRARKEIENQRLHEANDELTAKNSKLTRDLEKMENELTALQQRNNELKERNMQVEAQNKKLIPENKALGRENARLQRELDDKRKQLDEEMLQRIEFENRIHSAEERAAFSQSMCEKHLSETRIVRQTMDVSEVDNSRQESVEKHQKDLQELRKQYEDDLKQNREELTQLFEEKIKALEKDTERKSKLAAEAYDSQKRLQKELEQLQHEIRNLQDRIKHLERINNELEGKNQDERFRHNEEMSDMNKKIAKYVEAYQDLYDVKLSLDAELAAYKQLLEGEETRLNYTPGPSRANSFSEDLSTSATRSGGVKRRRADYEDESSSTTYEVKIDKSSSSDIEISDCCNDGSFVKLTNTGNREVLLDGWQIVRTVGERKISFKLHRAVKLEAGGTCTIWSRGAPVDHEPPRNIVMRTQKWFVGDDTDTQLLNNHGEQVAMYTQRKTERRVTHGRYNITGSTVPMVNGTSNVDDKCSIM